MLRVLTHRTTCETAGQHQDEQQQQLRLLQSCAAELVLDSSLQRGTQFTLY
jgi:hypothetical protein